MSVAVCQRCRRENNGEPADGVAHCPFDDADILRHIAADYCPFPAGPKFGTATPPEGWDDATIVTSPEPRPPEPVKPVPRDQWPAWVNGVAKLAKEGEGGVGDTLARLFDTAKVGTAYKALRKALGMPCSCEKDAARLSILYPYEN